MSALTDYFTSLADAIRSKTGKSDTLTPSQMIEEVENIPTGSSEKLQSVQSYTVKSLTGNLEPKIWNGIVSFYGDYVWTDGENIYYSFNSDQYVLDKATSTWTAKTWSGLTSFSGSGIWTDGDNIYYSNASDQYVLDKATSTWSAKTWSGLTSFYSYIWTDGENIYYSRGSKQYKFTKRNFSVKLC